VSPCGSPLSFETLVAHFANDLADDEAARVDEHLFACDACAEQADRLAGLVGALHEAVPPVLSRARRERLERAGKRLVVTPVAAGGEERAVFAPGVDYLVHVLRGDLAAARSVDLDLVTPDGTLLRAYENVPFDAAAGEVMIACQRHYEGRVPEDTRFRVWAHEGGERRRVGDYYIEHVWR
jgi:hypothetical protein